MLPFIACRHDVKTSDIEIEPAGEPERYSATVIRIVDDGTKRETTTSLEARSGEQRREEWTEGGRARAMILRPADGKGFLLDIDGRTYVELDIGTEITRSSQTVGSDASRLPASGNSAEIQDTTALGIDHYFDDDEPPSRLETRQLPDVVIDGHRCVGFEVRATYQDGHVETSRRFLATDLSRLLLRVECESSQATTRMTTERRNVSLDVGSEMFVIPADFKKVEKLQR
jgi:hypothetical protein